MTKKTNYSPEFKAQMVKEVQDVGDLDVVAKRHNVARVNLYRWSTGKYFSKGTPSHTAEILNLKKI